MTTGPQDGGPANDPGAQRSHTGRHAHGEQPDSAQWPQAEPPDAEATTWHGATPGLAPQTELVTPQWHASGRSQFPLPHQPADGYKASDPASAAPLEDPGTQIITPPAAGGPSTGGPGGGGPADGGTGSGPGSGSGSRPGYGPGTGSGSVSSSGSGPGTGGGTGSSAFPGGRRSASRSTRGRLGAGLVEVPRVPYRDPASAIKENPSVAEEKRFCGQCGAKVGRSSNGNPGAVEGTCDNCGTSFSFRPRLDPGDVVGGQYEVLGALAYGGLGWIYLAKDHNVSDRWVVLKGLINTGDETATQAAMAEQRFLAEVEHPNIVRIYNFVQHPDPRTGNLVGYIVMEYVGGQSLRQLALAHHRESGRSEPLPVGQVIAYGLEILPALGYLHGEGLLYCDLKPDNVIQTHEQLKLIDMGAVRHVDDYTSPLFFTSGYSAPELATYGASVASDIYTVGRTLAVLSFEFTGYTSTYKYSLPGPDEVPLFALFGSYYRALRKATREQPDRRFESCEDMADQLHGVLREIMALGTGKQRPAVSREFSPETRTFGTEFTVGEHETVPAPPNLSDVVVGLPVPQVDTSDPAAGMLAAADAGDAQEMLALLSTAPAHSVEVRLRTVRALLQLGNLGEATRQLGAARQLAQQAGHPYDWRLPWHEGLLQLAMGRSRDAYGSFDAVYDELPGELAPKLALAVSAEEYGDYFGASRLYELVWRTDRSYVSAAFGLARVYLAQGARASAIEVLDAVPDSSSQHVAAQVGVITIRTSTVGSSAQYDGGAGAHLSERELVDAGRRLERLKLDAERRAWLSVRVLRAALDWVAAGCPGGAGRAGRVLDCALAERDLRFGLERSYRSLARMAGNADDRIALVDRANEVRPRTRT